MRAGNRRVELRARLDHFWIPPDAPGLRRHEEILRAVHELIPDLEALDDDLGLTKAWQLVAMGDQTSCRYAKAEEDLLHALRYARRLGDRLEESEVRVSLLNCLYDGGLPADDGIRRCDAELQAARGDWMLEASALARSGGFHAMRGSFDLARELIDRSVALCDEFHVLNVYPTFERRDVEMLAGDFAAAEEWLRRAERNLSPLHEWWGLGFGVRASLADVLCAQERYDEVERLTEVLPAGASDSVKAHVLWRSARAKALARLGRADEAVPLAGEAVGLAERTDGLNLRAGALLDQAAVLRSCDRDEEAAQDIEKALKLYERKGNIVMAERTRRLEERLDHASPRPS